MNYIIWNDKDSRDIKGLLISELPPISKPNMRVSETTVDGVDGSTFEELGYESYNKPVLIGLRAGADVDKVIGYFTGEGKVIFSNEPQKYYRAKITGQIDFVRLLRYKTATVNFRVQPFKYDNAEVERYSLKGSTSMIVDNAGNYKSKPLITVIGSGDIRFSVNNNEQFRYTFPEGEDTVVIDSEKQDAYWGADLKNRNMFGEFPILQVGSNVIAWEGAVESVKITKYSRWL
jgi:phage-related protein